MSKENARRNDRMIPIRMIPLKMSENAGRICRACLEPSTKTYPLVGKILNVNVNIASMLEYCILKKLDLSNNLPQDVCMSCFKTIRLAYNFLKQFQESQEKLNKLYVCKEEQDEHEDECKGNTSNSSSQCDLQNIHDYSLGSQTTHNEFKIEDPEDIEESLNENLSEGADNEMYENENVSEGADNEMYENENVSEGADNEMYENESDNNEDVKEEYTQSNDEKAICDIKYFEGYDPEIFEFKFVKDESDMPEKVQSTNSNYHDIDFLQTAKISPGMKSVQAEKKVVQLVEDRFVSVVYKCPVCLEKNYQYNIFHKHLLSHRMKNIVCPWCTSKVELCVDEYFSHYKKVHKYQCDICNKRLSSSYGYLYHMKHHEDIKTHKCPFKGCKKSYTLSNLLKKHLALHTKRTVHPCDMCNTTFKSVGALKYHKKTHDGDRNHLCIHCGKAFYQAVHLRDHINRHMGHKAFTCDICGKSFITNSQLTKHIKLCTKKNRKIEAT